MIRHCSQNWQFLPGKGQKLLQERKKLFFYSYLTKFPLQPYYLLLGIVRELAGGGSVAMAICVNDRLQLTGDTQHVTPDKGHLIFGATIHARQTIQCLTCAVFFD